ARTAADGTYDLTVGPGTWQLGSRIDGSSLVGTGFLSEAGAPATATVSLIGPVTNVVRNLSVTSASRTLTGRVVDSHGTAVPRAWIHIDASAGSATRIALAGAAADDGSFSFNVPDGSYVVGAGQSGV